MRPRSGAAAGSAAIHLQTQRSHELCAVAFPPGRRFKRFRNVVLGRVQTWAFQFAEPAISQWLWTLFGAQPGKSVSAPLVAANAVMDEEEAVGIVFLLHGGQPEIV